MAILLSCQNLTKTFASRPLFASLSFGLFEGERTGLIGPNGTGKSTLLKILAELETPDGGTLSRRRGLHVRYLAQKDFFANAAYGITVREELTHALQGLGLEDWEIDVRIDEGVEGTGFHLDQQVASLSGGWKKRLAILSQVLTKPDLLLLDEPTNHLDVEGVQWLEKLLLSLDFSFLLISHDRYFLEAVCNRIIELNKRYENGHFSYAGNYSQFIENREAYFEAQTAQENSTRNKVRTEIEWLRKGPKARTTKQKARIDRAGEMISDLKELEYRNSQSRSMAIDFSSSERRSKKLIQAKSITKAMGGKKLFGPLDFLLGPGDKLGLLGGNGSGKSTLLKLIAGQLAPDTGTLERAEGLRVVTFDQHREQLDLTMPLRKALCENGDKVEFQGRFIHVAAWADRFLFTNDQLNMPLSRFSGGEQSRVLIARLMLKPADILLLDEPTNDLDINSLEVLESSLQDFPGALILVTHDRYLLDRVSRNILALDGKGNGRFFADLAQWEDALEAAEASSSAASEGPVPVAVAPPVVKKSLSKIEMKELASLETEIKRAEEQVKLAEAALADPAIASNGMELITRQKNVEVAQAAVSALMIRWGELESRR